LELKGLKVCGDPGVSAKVSALFIFFSGPEIELLLLPPFTDKPDSAAEKNFGIVVLLVNWPSAVRFCLVRE
jgi:hypothetical protein